MQKDLQVRKIVKQNNALLAQLLENQTDLTKKLKDCKESIDRLEEQRDQTFIELKDALESDNIIRNELLPKRYSNIKEELSKYIDLESKLKEEIDRNDITLKKAEIDFEFCQGNISDQNIQYYENKTNFYQNSIKSKNKQNRKSVVLEVSEIKRPEQEASEDKKLYKDSCSKINAVKTRELKEVEEELNKRMKNFQSLQENVGRIKENIKLSQNYKKIKKERQTYADNIFLIKAFAEGKNPPHELAKHKKINKINLKEKKLNKQIEMNKINIISKIVEERKNHLQKIQPTIHPVDTSSQIMRKKEKEAADKETQFLQDFTRNIESPAKTVLVHDFTESESENDICQEKLTSQTKKKIIVEPEFAGLWGKLSKIGEEKPQIERIESKKSFVINTDDTIHSKNIEFISKPAEVIFKDFDVSEKYVKKISLINTSTTISSCRFVKLEGDERLKDFITIDFKIPGKISPGMEWEFNIMFTPHINEELEGNLLFTSTNGSFSIPLKCQIKKFLPSISDTKLEFSSLIIGETSIKSLKLKNTGALSNPFKISTKQPENSQDDGTCEIEATKNAIEIYENQMGYLSPFSVVDIVVAWSPEMATKYEQEFIIEFENQNKSITFTVTGTASDLPVWIKNTNIEFDICTINCLYQDSVILNNRANTSLQIKFKIPQELSQYLTIKPEMGYIQAKSSYLAQVKLLPTRELLGISSIYYDNLLSLLQVPVVVLVKDQKQTIDFHVSAIITDDTLELETQEIDFGYCTTSESVVKTVKLHNVSLVPQSYGFVEKPHYVDVQPNDGYGIIIPGQNLDICFIFSAPRAAMYNDSITFQNGNGRFFKVSFKAIGVEPPLRLSHNLIQFKPTALFDTSSATISVINEHVDTNEFTHCIPKIGCETPAKVGDRKFQFILPQEEELPFSITPLVNLVKVGEKCPVNIELAPVLPKSKKAAIKTNIKKENSILKENAALTNKNEEINKNEENNKKSSQKHSKGSDPSDVKTDQISELAVKETICRNSSLIGLDYIYHKLYDYENNIKTYRVPCYISDEITSKNITYNDKNVLYLELSCPIIRPELLLISTGGKRHIDFGKVCRNSCITKRLVFLNTSDKTLKLTTTSFDENEVFSLRDVLRPIASGKECIIKLRFRPLEGIGYYDIIKFDYKISRCIISVSGEGVPANIEFSVKDKLLSMGSILANDWVEKIILLKNNSCGINVSYKIFQLSKSIKGFIDHEKYDKYIGTQNNGGTTVFDITPQEGIIKEKSEVQLKMTFSADRSSDCFSDYFRILFEDMSCFDFRVIGKAKEHLLYITENEDIKETMEMHKISESTKEKSIILYFYAYHNGQSFTPAEQTLNVHCIRSMAVSQQKNSEFSIEDLQQATQLGFQIDITKGLVEANTFKAVMIQWTPQENASDKVEKNDLRTFVTACLKTSVIEKIRINLVGFAIYNQPQ